MLKVAKINGFCDFCIPYNEKHDVLIEVLKELFEGKFDHKKIL